MTAKKQLYNWVAGFVVAWAFFQNAEAQTCSEAFFPAKAGTEWELTTYKDLKKSKIMGIAYFKIVDVKDFKDSVLVKVLTKRLDAKRKPIANSQGETESKTTYKCKDGQSFMDIFAGNKLLEDEGGDVSIQCNSDFAYPIKMEVDKDLTVIQCKGSTNGGSLTITVKSRVDAQEQVVIPVDSFDCFKITTLPEIQVNIQGIIINRKKRRIVSWIAKGIGTVKSENYKGTTLQSYTELTMLKKP